VLLTPIIAVAVGIIAYRQWKTAPSKLADIEWKPGRAYK
jgi:hypothetical protein